MCKLARYDDIKFGFGALANFMRFTTRRGPARDSTEVDISRWRGKAALKFFHLKDKIINILLNMFLYQKPTIFVR
jgi:hypothetical protein